MSKEHENRAIEKALKAGLEEAARIAYREGMKRAAQRVRYYLKHQRIDDDSFSKGITITCENLESIIEEEVKN